MGARQRDSRAVRVYTLCTGGKYSPDYIYRLRSAVQRNLSHPHEFVVVTDRDRPGVHCLMMDVHPGWWGKIDILGLPGPALFLDLDVVVTGPLDDLLGTRKDLRTARNWAQSGHGGCQSSVMYWEDASIVPAAFDFDTFAAWPPVHNPPHTYWGDQEFITLLRDRGQLAVDYFNPAHVVSYKYHCRGGLPDDARVVVFHGKPDPHEVADSWVKTCWA